MGDLIPGADYLFTLNGTVADVHGNLISAERTVKILTLKDLDKRVLSNYHGSVIEPFVYQTIQSQMTYRTYISDVFVNGNACTGVDAIHTFDGDNSSLYSVDYASMANMFFQNAAESTYYSQVRFNHSASNPHCVIFDTNYGGAIKYNVMNRFYRLSGTVEIEGLRRPAPNREAYASLDNTPVGTSVTRTWYHMYSGSNSGFHCLLGICGNQNIYAAKMN